MRHVAPPGSRALPRASSLPLTPPNQSSHLSEVSVVLGKQIQRLDQGFQPIGSLALIARSPCPILPLRIIQLWLLFIFNVSDRRIAPKVAQNSMEQFANGHNPRRHL